MSVGMHEKKHKMNHKKRGKAVIFDQELFRRSPKRRRSDADVTDLQETYKKLGFEVAVHCNLNVPDIKSVLTKRKFKQGVLN